MALRTAILSTRRTQISAGLTYLVRVKDVVLCFHSHMTCVSAVGMSRGIGGELAGCGVIVEHRVSPAAGLRKSFAVLLHYESLLKDIGHVHHEWRFRALLRLPLQFHDPGPIRKEAPVSGRSAFVRLDHFWVADNYLKDFFLMGERAPRAAPVS